MSQTTDVSCIPSKDLVVELLGRAGKKTTTFYDLTQGDSTAAVQALKAFSGTLPVDRVSAEAREHLGLLRRLQDDLLLLERQFVSAGDNLPKDIRALLRQQTRAVENETLPLTEPTSAVTRTLWTVGTALLIGWETAIAFLGEEKALLPRILGTEWRNTCLFIQYLMNPTANWDQYFDMLTQRLLLGFGTDVAYTVTILKKGVYGTKIYNAATTAVSISQLLLVMGPREYGKAHADHTIKHYLSSLATTPVEQLQAREATEAALGLMAGELSELRDIIKNVSDAFVVGQAHNNQMSRLRTALNTLISSLQAVATRNRPAAPHNEDRKKKLAIVGLGAAVAVALLASTFKSVISFVTNLRWSVFLLYRLIVSANNPAHTVRDTMDLFSQASTSALITLPIISIPLFVNEDAFDNRGLLIGASFALITLNATVVHEIGPKLLILFDMFRRFFAWLLTLGNSGAGAGNQGAAPAIDLPAITDTEGDAEEVTNVEAVVEGLEAMTTEATSAIVPEPVD